MSQAERLHRAIAGSELVVIENAGHFNYVEQPESFFAAVRSWL
jgi:proline iminopeptidase